MKLKLLTKITFSLVLDLLKTLKMQVVTGYTLEHTWRNMTQVKILVISDKTLECMKNRVTYLFISKHLTAGQK